MTDIRAHAAFRQALIGELPALRRYALGLAGNAHAADDLVQDCIERALRAAGSLEQISRIGAWLRRILHNLFVDELRRRGGAGWPVELASIDNDLSWSVQPAEMEVGELVRATQRLSLEHRQILLLVGVEGLSYREVADELGVPIGTVMSRLARARERLRAALAGDLLDMARLAPGGAL